MTNNKTGRKRLADPTGWYASEKLDGERAVWDGASLRTRGNKHIAAPEWFTRALPADVALDGELHAGRGKFQETMSTVRKHTPVDAEWRNIAYSVFDSPTLPGTFAERYEALGGLFREKKYGAGDRSHLQLTAQVALRDQKHLDEMSESLVAKGAEGVMVRNPDSAYENKRTRSLLKVKPLFDAEAKVIGYDAGKGKYANGRLGALRLRNDDGIEFAVGSGLTDDQRARGYEKRFPLGTVVTYQYMGLTDARIPRHPTFYRVRV